MKGQVFQVFCFLWAIFFCFLEYYSICFSTFSSIQNGLFDANQQNELMLLLVMILLPNLYQLCLNKSVPKYKIYAQLFYNTSMKTKTIQNPDSQFICKLCDMMEKHTPVIHWSQDGLQLNIDDINLMESQVLPNYFRHHNFPSFVRQLNMYGFHKECASGCKVVFSSDTFKKGNQTNFHLIQRKRKDKEHHHIINKFNREYETLQNKLLQSIQTFPKSTAFALIDVLKFNYIALETNKKLKHYVQSICNQLKNTRSKKISGICNQLMADSDQLAKLVESSKQIDYIARHKLGNELDQIQPKVQPQYQDQGNIVNIKSNHSFTKLLEKRQIELDQQRLFAFLPQPSSIEINGDNDPIPNQDRHSENNYRGSQKLLFKQQKQKNINQTIHLIQNNCPKNNQQSVPAQSVIQQQLKKQIEEQCNAALLNQQAQISFFHNMTEGQNE